MAVSFPTAKYVNSLNIKPMDAIAMSRSNFSFSERTYDWGGEMWMLEGGLPPLTRAEAAEFKVFVLQCKGPKNPFLFPVPERTPRGVGTGTPLVNGADQVGSSLVTDGWTPSTTGILLKADWIQLGSGDTTRLHMVTGDVDSDGSGNATIPIWPALRESPLDNAAITVNDCMGLFRLSANIGWDQSVDNVSSIQFSAEEALNG